MSTPRTFNADARAEERGKAEVIIGGKTFHPLAKLPNRELRSIRKLAAESQRVSRAVDLKFGKRDRELTKLEEAGEDAADQRAVYENERDDAEEAANDRAMGILTDQIAVLLRDPDGKVPSSKWLADELDYRDAQGILSWLLEDAEGNSSTPTPTTSATTSP